MKIRDLKPAKQIIASLALALASFIMASVSLFFLPAHIYVQVFGASSVPETDMRLFLVVGFVLCLIASAMTVYTENRKKWLALQSVITLAYFGCIIYNLIVMR